MKRENELSPNLVTLADVHRAFGLPKPLHPLISIIDAANNQAIQNALPPTHVLNFYKISYKAQRSGKLRYGQGYYDFDEGGLLFAAPNQLIGHRTDADVEPCSMYTLLIHPDFLWNYTLAKKIKQYGFFAYSANEGLHLSDQEKTTIISVFDMIHQELNSRIDDLSQDVIISQIELLLTYADRFYKRQFITRKAASGPLLEKLEEILEGCFNDERAVNRGIPTVQYLADQLNISPSYLSDMLRSLTGQNAQQHIHNKLIEKAKERLSTSSMSISEIAYALGFEHPQSFSKLFKTKTNQTPVTFRASFN